VSVDGKILGVIVLSDVLKTGIRERISQLRQIGIRTVMVTGDNPVTAAAIAAQAGVAAFVAEARPEDKLHLIQHEQSQGRLVAMTGDGTNDAPALAQADVGLAMHSGTMPAKEAANLIDLESDPTKLIDLVRIGKQMLITRGAVCRHHVLHCQRRGEVLRHHSRHVHRRAARALGSEHHGPCNAA